MRKAQELADMCGGDCLFIYRLKGSSVVYSTGDELWEKMSPGIPGTVKRVALTGSVIVGPQSFAQAATTNNFDVSPMAASKAFFDDILAELAEEPLPYSTSADLFGITTSAAELCDMTKSTDTPVISTSTELPLITSNATELPQISTSSVTEVPVISTCTVTDVPVISTSTVTEMPVTSTFTVTEVPVISTLGLAVAEDVMDLSEVTDVPSGDNTLDDIFSLLTDVQYLADVYDVAGYTPAETDFTAQETVFDDFI